jgi:hypothetical protein
MGLFRDRKWNFGGHHIKGRPLPPPFLTIINFEQHTSSNSTSISKHKDFSSSTFTHPTSPAKMKLISITALLGLAAFAVADSAMECSPIAAGPAPIKDPLSVEAFENDPLYKELAKSAATPAGYSAAFNNYNSSYINPQAYMGYRALAAYNPQECAAHCSSVADCKAINLYVERTPTQVCLS